MSLELSAMRWLWLVQKCLVVLEQRTPNYAMGQPDVLGITPGRYLTEIEVKRSYSDFRADFKKLHRINRERHINQQPRLFYYMVTPDLVEKVRPELPPWAGLMTPSKYDEVDVIVRSPVNAASAKLTLKQCTRLARMMTTHMMGYAIQNNSIKCALKHGHYSDHTDWVDANVGTYQI